MRSVITHKISFINPLYKGRIVFIGFRTSGQTNKDRIVELGLAEMIGGEITNRAFHSYFNPHKDISPDVLDENAYMSDFFIDKPDIESKLDDISDFLHGAIIVGHNLASFRYFLREFPGLTVSKSKSISLWDLSNSLHPDLNTLKQLITKYHSDEILANRSALDDARIIADIYQKLVNEYQGVIGNLKPEERFEIDESGDVLTAEYTCLVKPGIGRAATKREFPDVKYEFDCVNPCYSGRVVSIDCETTGLEDDDPILELGLVEMNGFEVTGREFHSYFNPQKTSSSEAFAVHGLTAEFLSDKPLFVEKREEIVEFLRDAVLIGHNVHFDVRFLKKEIEFSGDENFLECKCACSMEASIPLFSRRPKLDELIERYLIWNDRKLHSAIDDARYVAKIYPEILKDLGFENTQYDKAIPILKTCVTVDGEANNVFKNPWAVKYMEPSQITKDMAYAISSYSWENVFEYLPQELQTPRICWIVIKTHPWNIAYIKNQTEEMCLYAVRQIGNVLRDIRVQTPEICLEAVKNHSSAIQYVNNQTEELCRLALLDDGNNLRFIKNQTVELCELAVRRVASATKYIKDSALKKRLKAEAYAPSQFSIYTCNQAKEATNKKPNFYVLCGEKVEVKNFAQMLRSVVEKLYCIDDNLIKAIAIEERRFITVLGFDPYDILLSYNSYKVKGKFQLGETGIFISSGFSAATTILLIGQLLDLFEIPREEFTFSAR